ncbi:MAG: hypothetical protein M3Y28_09800 [Armatimonadota bacterium]|nr:hypothetical protein [Armatimonadota bacterium]
MSGSCQYLRHTKSQSLLHGASIARIQQEQIDEQDAKAAWQAKNYALAEDGYRNLTQTFPTNIAYHGLAKSLAAQGKTAEAIQAYYGLFHPGPNMSWGGSYIPQAQLEDAVLLSQSGRWPEAVALYEKALPNVSDRGMSKINVHFDPAVPQPTELQAAAEIGIGLETMWAGSGLDDEKGEPTFQAFAKALKLAPNWPVANYYYGYGWQNLKPKDRVRLAGQREAVKAALQKATKSGTCDVSAGAMVELQSLR